MVRTRNKPKQTRLSFAPVGLATDGDSTIGGKADRLAKVRYGHPSAPSLVDQRPTSYRDTKKSGKSRKRKDLPDINRQKSPEVMLTSSNIKREHEESDDEGIPAEGSSRERNNTSNIKREPEESDNEDIATDNSSHGRNNTEESDENEIITKPSFQTKCDTSERDDEIITNPGGKLRRGAAPKPAIELDSDSEEEPVASSPAKRRKRNMASDILQTPRRNSNQHNIDLEEDLEDLRDSGITQPRLCVQLSFT